MPRKPVNDEVAADVIFLHARTCCVCNIPNKPFQLHHIDDDPSNGVAGNLAVLCFDCHDQTQITGGFSRKLRAPEVIKHRTEWLARVAERRRKADEVVISKMSAEAYEEAKVAETLFEDYDKWKRPPVQALKALIESLPKIYAEAYERAERGYEETTVGMKVREWTVIDVLEKVLVLLAAWYPPNTFDSSPQNYFSEYLARRGQWHHAVASPDGPHSGTIVGVIASVSMRQDAETAVEDMVDALSRYIDDFDYEAWRASWKGGRG